MRRFLSALSNRFQIRPRRVLDWSTLLIVVGTLASVHLHAQDANAPPAPSVQLAVVESSTSAFLRWTVDTNTNVSDQVVTETRITWQAQGSDESNSVDVEVNTTNCDSTSSYPITCETTLEGLISDTSYSLALEAHGVVYEAGTTTVETDYGFGASTTTNRQTHGDFELEEDLLAGSERQQRMPFARLVSNNSATSAMSSIALFTFLTERGIDTSASNPHLWSYSASVSPRNAVRSIIVIDFDTLVEDDLFRLVGTYRDSERTTARVTVTATYKNDTSIKAKRDIVFAVVKNRAPVFGVTSVTYEMPEDDPSNIYVAGNFRLTDAENHSVTYSLETVEPEEAVFEIDEQSGVISVIEGEELDYETATEHILHVTAIDSVGDSSNNLVIVVEVLNVDEGPVLGEHDNEDMEVRAHQNMGVDENWVNFHVRNWFVDEEDDPLCYSAEITEGSNYATVNVSTSGSSDCGLPHVQVRRIAVLGANSVQEVEVEITATEDIEDDPGSVTALATVSIVYGTNIEPNILGGRLVNASENSAYLDSYDAGSETEFEMDFTALDVLPHKDRVCYTLAGRDRLHFELVYPDKPYEEAVCTLQGSNSTEGSISNSHQIRVKSVRPLERGRSDSTYRFDLVATDLSGFADTLAFELTTDNVWSGLISHPMPDAHFLVGDSSETIVLSEYFDHTKSGQADNLIYDVRSGNNYAVQATEFDGELTLTPADSLPGDRVTTYVEVVAEDEDGYTVRELFDVHVKQHNNAPRIERITRTYSLEEDLPVSQYFSKAPHAYDTDDDDLYFRMSEEDLPFFTDPSTGHIAFQQELDFESKAEYEITLYVEDGFGGEDSEKITITVIDVNEAPIPTDEVIADVELLVGMGLPDELLSSDHFTDEDTGDVLDFDASTSDYKTVEVELDDNGYLIVEAIEEGEATISLTATDSGDPPLQASKSFLVTVNENLAPTVVEPLVDIAVSVGAEKELDLETVFEDEPEDIHTYTAESADTDIATVELSDSNLTVSGQSEGTVQVTITITDVAENETTAQLTVNVNINKPPVVAQAIESLDTRVGRITDILLSSHFEDEGDELVFEAVVDDDEVVEVSIIEDETLQITGVAEGSTSCTVTATDTLGESVSDEFTINVFESNDPPILTRELDDIEISLVSHVRYDVDIEGLFDDEKPDELEITIETSTDEYADVVLRENNTVIRIYPLKRGAFFITVKAEDDIAQTASTDFQVVILEDEVNTAPTVDEPIADQTIHVDEDFETDLGDVFFDAEMDELTFTAESDDTDVATVDISESNVLTVHGESAGTATITAEATDPSGESATDTFRVTVKTAPQADEAVADVTLQYGGESLSLDMFESFSDADGDPLAFHTLGYSSTQVANASLTQATLFLVPVQRGNTSIVVVASDPDGNSAQKQFNIIVSDEELMTVAQNALAGYGRNLLTTVTTAIGDRATLGPNDSDLSVHNLWSHIARRNQRGYFDEAPINGDPSFGGTSIGSTRSLSQFPNGLNHPVGAVHSYDLERTPSRSGFADMVKVWSTTDLSSYAGEGYNGEAETRLLGVDLSAFQNGVAGLALMSSESDSAYSWGTAQENLRTSLRSVIPYFTKELNDNYAIWASIGYGRGNSTILSDANQIVSTSPLTMNLGAVGMRRNLTSQDSFNLSLRTDISGINLVSKKTEVTGGLSATAHQFRLALDGSLTKQVTSGLKLTPFGQVGLRHEHGDDIRGEGVEVRGGLRLTTPSVQIEARGNRFKLNDHANIQESGWSITASYDLNNDQLGWNLELSPSQGCASRGEEFEWMRSVTQETAGFGDSCSSRKALRAKVGYGSYLFNDRFKFDPRLSFEKDKWGNTRRSIGAQVELGLMSSRKGVIGIQVTDLDERLGDAAREFVLTGSISF